MYYFDMTPLPIIILIVVILVILARCIRVVQQSKAYVIERLGAFHAVWSVGLHFKLPFIDRIQRVVSLKEQVADFPPQPVITKDNVTMQIDTVLYFQITDPKLYAYGVENPMNAIENLTATTLRNIIGELELDQSLTSRDVINARMRSILDEATDPWGIKVNRVELKNIPPRTSRTPWRSRCVPNGSAGNPFCRPKARSRVRSWWLRAKRNPASCGLTPKNKLGSWKQKQRLPPSCA